MKKNHGALLRGLGCVVLGLVWMGGVQAAWSLETIGQQAKGEVEAAFEKGDFEKTLELLEPLLKADPQSSKLNRLHMLSLVLLGKSKEGFSAYEKVVIQTGREDDMLLRELAIKSILPFRMDMREQIRGASYSALREIESDTMVPYLLDGLQDKTGMIRALVVEGLGKLPNGRKSQEFLDALNDQAGLVRAYVLKGLGRSQDRA